MRLRQAGTLGFLPEGKWITSLQSRLGGCYDLEAGSRGLEDDGGRFSSFFTTTQDEITPRYQVLEEEVVSVECSCLP